MLSHARHPWFGLEGLRLIATQIRNPQGVLEPLETSTQMLVPTSGQFSSSDVLFASPFCRDFLSSKPVYILWLRKDNSANRDKQSHAFFTARNTSQPLQSEVFKSRLRRHPHPALHHLSLDWFSSKSDFSLTKMYPNSPHHPQLSSQTFIPPRRHPPEAPFSMVIRWLWRSPAVPGHPR